MQQFDNKSAELFHFVNYTLHFSKQNNRDIIMLYIAVLDTRNLLYKNSNTRTYACYYLFIIY